LQSLETLECGKVFGPTLKGDLQWTMKLIRYFAGLADKNNGQTLHPDGPYVCYTLHEPVGVCGLITAWNFASLMAAWKIAPALAAGNTPRCSSVSVNNSGQHF
jgi:aldehyde dehydrogenase (NAD+)